MTKNTSFALIIIFLIIVAVASVFWIWFNNKSYVVNPIEEVGLNGAPQPSLNLDQSISDGTILLNYPSTDFGLAVNPEQILATSYIPPCNPEFNYCLYYNGAEYKGTNFESAGLRIQKRTDMTSERL